MNIRQHKRVNSQGHTIELLVYADDLVLLKEPQNKLITIQSARKVINKIRFTI